MSTATALLAEFHCLHPGAEPPSGPLTSKGYLNALRRACFDQRQAALCLSGGGIRSAAFALGVIQSLARNGLLSQFHYLSTVSGGGYTGSWLQNWIARKDFSQVEEALQSEGAEPPEIRWLRSYSNFLTPEIGIASIDTWTAAVLFVRNLLLNWLIILPMFLAGACVLQIYFRLAYFIPVQPWLPPVLIGLCAASLLIAVTTTCRWLPSHREGSNRGSSEIFWRIILPALVWVFGLPLILAKEKVTSFPNWVLVFALNITVYLTAYGIALYLSRTNRKTARLFVRNLPFWLISVVVAAGLAASGFALTGPVAQWSGMRFDHGWAVALALLLGPLALTLSQLVLMSLYAALRRTNDARSDVDREWLARLSAFELRITLSGCAMIFLVVLVPLLLRDRILPEGWEETIAGIVTLASAAISVVGGRSPKSGESLAAVRPSGWIDLVTSVAAVVFIGALVVLSSFAASAGAHWLAGWFVGVERLGWPDPFIWPTFLGFILVGVIALVVGWRASVHIKPNNFSMHGTYRNRLIRCFLGASCADRDADGFTGFATDDNPKLASLRTRFLDCTPRRLFPVVNTTLNLVKTTELAWQERKAASFTFTPLACGSAVLGSNDSASSPGVYIDPQFYGGTEKQAGWKGVSLGTAMAISGAAASPSMGYHTSAVTSFLMTMFNVRLGAWLPNPAVAKDLQRSGPELALKPLVAEMFGLTGDRGQDVYLSDGGHFENLGLYEMIRRGCRFVLVSDAGCDQASGFADLGDAIRKVRIDFDVEIEMHKMVWIKSASGVRLPHGYATGTITYPGIPDKGYLLYLKPSLIDDDLPIDVEAYGRANPDFPHQSTLDQFFSESQFEAYRNLGSFLMNDSIRKITSAALPS